MRIDVSLVLSAVIGLILFSYYYSIPPKITILTAEEILNFIPEAYAHPNDKPLKIVFDVESYRGYHVIIFWYYWPYDGFKAVNDWEPVVVYAKDGEVVAVATRVHYVWRVNFNPPLNGSHPLVTFGYLYHTPLLQKPFEGWVKVTPPLTYEQPPEDVDVGSIVEWSLSPTRSALYAAITYSLLGSIMFYAFTAGILREKRFITIK